MGRALVCRQGWCTVPVAGAILSPLNLLLWLWELLWPSSVPGSDSDRCHVAPEGLEQRACSLRASLWQGGAGSYWLLPLFGPSSWNPSFRSGSWSFWSWSLTEL